MYLIKLSVLSGIAQCHLNFLPEKVTDLCIGCGRDKELFQVRTPLRSVAPLPLAYRSL